MSEVSLLDTPKRASLQSRADTIRAALKGFERSFADEHDRKPNKEDIKANEKASRKYKEYNKLRDVIAGKVGLDALDEGSPKRKRQDKPVGNERKKKQVELTPKAQRVLQDGLYDEVEGHKMEDGIQLTAIGPTPQRDGMVMGLFDIMSNPGSGRHLWSGGMRTPGSKRRKVDVLGHHDDGVEALVAATPEQKTQELEGDLLQFLGGATPATARAKHSRTPISEGRKFMLNQFFATPSAVRYSQILQDGTPKKEDGNEFGKTPLKTHVLGLTPSTKCIVEEDKDRTPNYLKRSHSFKDRLLSASTTSVPASKRKSLDTPLSPVSLRSGATLPKARPRYQPKPLSQIAAEIRQRDQEQRNTEGGDEDDMDALREMEDADLNVQTGLEECGGGEVTRLYKKKGQKRTTRRVIMKPQPTALKAKKVIEEEERVEETQIQDVPDHLNEDEWSDDELFQALAADENNDANANFDDDEFNDTAAPAEKRKTASKNPGKQGKALAQASKSGKASREDGAGKDKPRTYNPNATAHMNFKSLKIKNKNSKGKSRGRGGARFGGRRR